VTNSPASEERVAFEVVRRVLGVEVEHYDRDGRQGVVDGLIHLALGRLGALEITTHSGPGERELLARLAQDGNTWPNPGRWWWRITVDRPEHINKVKLAYGQAILLCEAHSVTDPEDLPWRTLKYAPAVRWLLEAEIGMRGHPDVPSRTDDVERGVMVTPSATGGAVDEQLESMNEVLAALYEVPSVARRIEKLRSTLGVDQRHLFLILSLDAVPFGTSYGLSFGSLLPTSPPPMPDGLSHLWLATGYGRRVLLWDSVRWSQHYPYDR
jgi:hypothetical protein